MILYMLVKGQLKHSIYYGGNVFNLSIFLPSRGLYYEKDKARTQISEASVHEIWYVA